MLLIEAVYVTYFAQNIPSHYNQEPTHAIFASFSPHELVKSFFALKLIKHIMPQKKNMDHAATGLLYV